MQHNPTKSTPHPFWGKSKRRTVTNQHLRKVPLRAKPGAGAQVIEFGGDMAASWRCHIRPHCPKRRRWTTPLRSTQEVRYRQFSKYVLRTCGRPTASRRARRATAGPVRISSCPRAHTSGLSSWRKSPVGARCGSECRLRSRPDRQHVAANCRRWAVGRTR